MTSRQCLMGDVWLTKHNIVFARSRLAFAAATRKKVLARFERQGISDLTALRDALVKKRLMKKEVSRLIEIYETEAISSADARILALIFVAADTANAFAALMILPRKLDRSTSSLLEFYFLNGGLMKRRAAAGLALLQCPTLQVARCFLSCLKDANSPTALRGIAAEGLGAFLSGNNRQSALRKQAEDTLLKCLRDRSPTVRFWSAYSLGILRCTRATGQLKIIAKRDRATCAGWWRVCDEAADAILRIQGLPTPDRVGGGA